MKRKSKQTLRHRGLRDALNGNIHSRLKTKIKGVTGLCIHTQG